jgi:alcohol dehydrogenase (NADP+)
MPQRKTKKAVMSTVTAYAATSATEPLTKTTIERRAVGAHDVAIEIKFAGICHSDIHTVRAEWGQPYYPLVPGHEIAGVVTEVGAEVTKHKVGDRVGVGCFVDSCRECESCLAGL